jgi:hypothetical protein
MSANLYRTKNEGEFFHIHGSLEATTTLNMIGLEGHRPDLTDYEEIIKVIESHVQKYSAAELEEMNKERRQAGVTAFKYEDFIKTPHVCSCKPSTTKDFTDTCRANSTSNNLLGKSPNFPATCPQHHSPPTEAARRSSRASRSLNSAVSSPGPPSPAS